MYVPAQAVEIDLKYLSLLCLEAGSGAGRHLESGEAAEWPDFSWTNAFMSFLLPQDGPVQTNPPLLSERTHSLEGLGTGEGEDLVLQMEKNAGRKKTT